MNICEAQVLVCFQKHINWSVKFIKHSWTLNPQPIQTSPNLFHKKSLLQDFMEWTLVAVRWGRDFSGHYTQSIAKMNFAVSLNCVSGESKIPLCAVFNCHSVKVEPAQSRLKNHCSKFLKPKHLLSHFKTINVYRSLIFPCNWHR